MREIFINESLLKSFLNFFCAENLGIFSKKLRNTILRDFNRKLLKRKKIPENFFVLKKNVIMR